MTTSHCDVPHFCSQSQFKKKNKTGTPPPYSSFALMNDICDPRREASPLKLSPKKRGAFPRWTLPRCPSSSPFRATLPRWQPRLGNRSLFKSFMSIPQKRKAESRRRGTGSTEHVVARLARHDLRRRGCNGFDNHSLFSLSREERRSQRFQATFIPPLLIHKHLLLIFSLFTSHILTLPSSSFHK